MSHAEPLGIARAWLGANWIALVLGPAAVSLYGISWFLPVVNLGGLAEPSELPGWEALRLALSPLWPYEDFVAEGSIRASLAVASAFTNLLFLVCAVALFEAWRRGRSARWVAYPLMIAALIDAAWLWSSPAWLSWGYYCWLGSFLLLALAADRLRAKAPVEAMSPEVAEADA